MAGKIGEGHAAAMMRLGLKELRNAVSPGKESIADSEIGIFGSMTQGEIANSRGGPGKGLEQEAMSVDGLRDAAKEKAQERGQDGPERERER